MSLNLRHLILSVADKGPEDPRAVTAAVLSRITKKDEREALEQSLVHMVRSLILDRSRTPIVAEAAANAMPSAKRIAIAAQWQKQLRDRYAIPTDGGAFTHKFLADMTYEDILAAAQGRTRSGRG